MFSQDRQNPGHVQKKSVARFRTGPKYTARCMDVQLGVWKVVPRAEMFVHRRCCWLGFVAQKRFTCPRKKWGLNRAQTPFSADISRMQNNPPQTCPKSRSVASHVRPPSPPRSWLHRGSALSNFENSGAGLSELLEEERMGWGG